MRLTVILAALCAVLFASNAEARPKHTSPHQGEVGCSDPIMRPCYPGGAAFSRRQVPAGTRGQRRLATPPDASRRLPMPPALRRVIAEGAGRVINWGKPRAWCGWWMRKHLGVANPAGNMARWWAGFGRPAHGPHVGAIVVWARGRRHGHVGIITGRTAAGRWIVKSGNDGNRVRERPRSVAGAIAFRWPA